MTSASDEFFPSLAEIEARLKQARARPNEWRSANARIIREFVMKTEALGLASADGWYIYGSHPDPHPTLALHGLAIEVPEALWIRLIPGPPIEIEAKVVRSGGGFYETYDITTHVHELDSFPGLSLWDPVILQAELARALPR